MLYKGHVCGEVSELEQSEKDINLGRQPMQRIHPWEHLEMGTQRWSRLRESTWEKVQRDMSSRTNRSSCKETPNAGC